MLRTALLGGNTITLDADLSKYIETVSDQGVIEGLEVGSNSVAPGKAWVKATRSNGETIMVLVQNTEVLAVDTSGTKKIWLEIKQEAIDNGALNNEDGTGIASIKTGPTLPSQNFLLLASVDNGRLTDQRAMIPKIQSVASRTDSLEEKMESAENNISVLQDKGTPQYLGKFVEVGEAYQAGDVMVERGGKLVGLLHSTQREGLNMDVYSSTVHRYLELDIASDEEAIVQIKGIRSTRYAAEIRVGTGREDKSLGCVLSRPGEAFDSEVKIPQGTSKVYLTIKGVGGNPTTNLTIANVVIVSKRVNFACFLYPREVKSIGERVECTLLGLHSDGNFIGTGVKHFISKTIEGDASAVRNAPCNGLLEVEYVCYENKAYINDINLVRIDTRTVYHSISGRTLFYVNKGEVKLRTGVSRYNSGTYNSKITLTGFIPL